MNTLESVLRPNAEWLIYVSFFGLLLLLAVLELVLELGDRPPGRRRRWPVNWGLTALNILLLGAIPVTALAAADHARESGLGLMNWLGLSLGIAAVLGFLMRSFTAWCVHLSMHKVPLLWRFHRVHHCDVEMDVSTTVRFHPLELLVSVPVTLVVIVALGIPPVAVLVFEIADAVIAVFSHANVRLPRLTERGLGWLIITPHMHRVHHSSWQLETDSNFGATLSCWDRLFCTYREKPVADLAAMELGLRECQDERPSSFWWLLALPFRPLRIDRVRRPDGRGRSGFAVVVGERT